MKNKLISLIVFWTISFMFVVLSYIFQGSYSVLFRFAVIFVLVSSLVTMFLFRRHVESKLKRGKVSRIKLFEAFAVVVFGSALFGLSNSFDLNIDWTPQRLFKISDETKQIINKIEEPLKITLFSYYDPNDPNNVLIQYAERIAKRYRSFAPGKITFNIVDPVRNKSLAEKYNVMQNGTLVFEMNDRVEFVLPTILVEKISKDKEVFKGESIFTAVIDKLIKNEDTFVYYLTGHGELDFLSGGSIGYNRILGLIKDRRYVVKPLNLNHHREVPKDTDVIIIADPRTTFSPAVFDSLDKYMNNGGSTLFLLGQNTTPDINPLLIESGFVFIPNVAIDPALTAKNGGDLSIIPYLSPKSEITSMLSRKNLGVMFPTSSIVGTLTKAFWETNSNYLYDIYPLARMSKNGFGETSFKTGMYKKEKGDIEGVTTLAIASIAAKKEDPGNQRRSVAIGSLDFIDNSRVNFGGNAQLFLNSIDFLLKNDLKTTVPPKSHSLTTAVTTPSQFRAIVSAGLFWVLAWLVFAGFFLISRQNKVREKK